jgi:hypothetical protein
MKKKIKIVKKSENKNNNVEKSKSRINWKVILYSVIAIICIYLMYRIDWIFIVPVLILIWLNQRELFGKN